MVTLKHHTFVDYATQGYAALVAVLVMLFHNETVPRWHLIVLAHVGILLFIQTLIYLHQRSPSNRPISFLRHFYPVLLYTWFFSETGWLNRMFFKGFMDPAIIRWEQALLGCQPSTLFMQKLPYLLVSELFYASYFSYYVMISGIGLALYLRDRRQFFHYVSVISFVFYICYAIYIVLPIIGPRVFFHDVAGYSLPDEVQRLASTEIYPTSIQAGVFFRIMALIYRLFEAPGAAFPSSHVAIALTTVFFSFKYLRPIRFVHLFVAILLCLSTIYCRYHYVLDVVAGALTAALLLPISNWLYWKTAEVDAAPKKPELSGQNV